MVIVRQEGGLVELSAVSDEMIDRELDSSSHRRVLRPLRCGPMGARNDTGALVGSCRCHSVHYRNGVGGKTDWCGCGLLLLF